MKKPEIKTPKITPTKKATAPEPDLPNFEEATSKEVEEFRRKLRESTNLEQAQIQQATSTGFYFCVYFADPEQRDEFIKNAGLNGAGIGQYYNGETVAKALGVKITKRKIDRPKVFRFHKNLSHFTQ